MLNTNLIKIDNQLNVENLLKTTRELIHKYNEHTFHLSCTFLCNAGFGTDDFEITRFDSSILPTTSDGITSLCTEFTELDNKAREEFFDFEVKMIKDISVTLIPKASTR